MIRCLFHRAHAGKIHGGARFAGHAILLLTSLLALFGCGERSGDSRSSPPSPRIIVVWLVDTLRPDHLQTYGYERPTSPRISELASDAVLFRQAYSASPWTKPSVATIMTSLYPITHGALEKADVLAGDLETAAEIFRDNGYETAAIVASPWITGEFGFDQGFDSFYVVKRRDRIREAKGQDVWDTIETFFASRDNSRPLFLYIHTRDPHSPYRPPTELVELVAPGYDGPPSFRFKDDSPSAEVPRGIVDLYDGEILHTDNFVGKLIDLMKEKGIYSSSAFVLTADHGEEFLDHNGYQHGERLWEEQVRVPLIIRFPEAWSGGTEIDEPVTLLDLLPTLARLAGIDTAGKGFAGRNLIPLAGRRETDETRPMFMDESRDLVELFALRRGDFKAIYQTRPQERFMLFNLSTDPKETKNIARTERAIAAAMRSEIEERIAPFEAGYRIVISGGPEPALVEGRIRVSGKVQDIVSRNMNDDDVLEETDEGFRFRFQLDEFAEGFAMEKNAIPPRQVIFFRTDPPRAALDCEFDLNGALCDTRLISIGSEGHSPSRLPLQIAAGSAEAAIDRRRARATPTLGGGPVNILIGYLAEAPRTEIDPKTVEELKALGYLQ